jgi:hypothetical protein
MTSVTSVASHQCDADRVTVQRAGGHERARPRVDKGTTGGRKRKCPATAGPCAGNKDAARPRPSDRAAHAAGCDSRTVVYWAGRARPRLTPCRSEQRTDQARERGPGSRRMPGLHAGDRPSTPVAPPAWTATRAVRPLVDCRDSAPPFPPVSSLIATRENSIFSLVNGLTAVEKLVAKTLARTACRVENTRSILSGEGPPTCSSVWRRSFDAA